MDKIEVTQDDKDAAASLMSDVGLFSNVLTAKAVQAFARHRLATRTDATPVAVEMVAELQLSAFLAGRGSIRTKANGNTHESSPGPTMDDYRRMARFALAEGQVDATPVAEAWEVFEAAMKDPGYAWGWHCNLAVPIMDATGITHKQANMAAAHLMQHLWKCDITTHPDYQYEKSGAQAYAEFRIEADKAEGAALPDAAHPPATDVAALVENGCEMPEVAAMRYIEELRSDLAASVTILCDNEEAWTKDEQMAVEVIAEWTDWIAKRFMGESVIQCLARAIGARRQALAPFTKGQNDG